MSARVGPSRQAVRAHLEGRRLAVRIVLVLLAAEEQDAVDIAKAAIRVGVGALLARQRSRPCPAARVPLALDAP